MQLNAVRSPRVCLFWPVAPHKTARLPRPELSVFASREDMLAMKLSELRRYALTLGLGEDQCEGAFRGKTTVNAA